MLSQYENDMLSRVGPGTSAGELFRRYWVPAGISDEVSDVPKPVRLLGEDLELFRDDDGTPGLLGLQCPHRLSSLEYGRVECGGLRCIYHGWLFDVNGACLEQPGEPAGSTFVDAVRHTAYPCRDHGGLVFTYMGPGEPPLLPNFDILARQDGTRRIAMDWMVHPCNYLQLVENNMDPIHTAVLHADREIGQNSLFGNMPLELDFEETEVGLRYRAVRPGPQPDTHYIRQVNSMMPFILGFGGGKHADHPELPEFGGSLRWQIPMDDTHTALLSVYFTPFHNGRPADTPTPVIWVGFMSLGRLLTRRNPGSPPVTPMGTTSLIPRGSRITSRL